MALALSNSSSDPVALAMSSFSTLHELLARDKLDYDEWLLIEGFLPDLHWLKRWDKCERLRRGVITAFIQYNWPSQALLHFADSPYMLERLALSAREVKDGKRLLKDLLQRIQGGEVSVSREERKALKAKED